MPATSFAGGLSVCPLAATANKIAAPAIHFMCQTTFLPTSLNRNSRCDIWPVVFTHLSLKDHEHACLRCRSCCGQSSCHGTRSSETTLYDRSSAQDHLSRIPGVDHSANVVVLNELALVRSGQALIHFFQKPLLIAWKTIIRFLHKSLLRAALRRSPLTKPTSPPAIDSRHKYTTPPPAQSPYPAPPAASSSTAATPSPPVPQTQSRPLRAA